MQSPQIDRVHAALDGFRIELPSWGFANTGTRFGKFVQPAAATTIEEKFADAGHVHALTGACPTLALHVLWDFENGAGSVPAVAALGERYGVRPGSINPNLFQDQVYKFGSLGNPDAAIRRRALEHMVDSVQIAAALHSRDVSLWFADGSNYPGTANIRRRASSGSKRGCARPTPASLPGQRLLVEYKPFEPAFYHTDIADWGMALLLARAAGPQARVLVDTGHHYLAQNIEQIVAWLLAEDMLGGFHFNDRRYADDDLTLGSIDPYQMFRIFHEIRSFERGHRRERRHRLHDRPEPQPQGEDRGDDPDRHRRAGAVREGRAGGSRAPARGAGGLGAGDRGVAPAGRIRDRRAARDPRMAVGKGTCRWTRCRAFREGGYLERITSERARRNAAAVSSYA